MMHNTGTDGDISSSGLLPEQNKKVLDRQLDVHIASDAAVDVTQHVNCLQM